MHLKLLSGEQGAPRNFQREGSDKGSRQKWPILLLQRSNTLAYLQNLIAIINLNQSESLSLDSCLTMSAINMM